MTLNPIVSFRLGKRVAVKCFQALIPNRSFSYGRRWEIQFAKPWNISNPYAFWGVQRNGSLHVNWLRGPKFFVERKLSSKSLLQSDNIATLQMKKRLQRKKKYVEEDESHKKGYWNIMAYSTAEEYNLDELEEGLLEQNLYQVSESFTSAESAHPDPVVHVIPCYPVSNEPREIFFFREGSVVFWNVPELERSNVLKFLKRYEINSYEQQIVSVERESMFYKHVQGKSCVSEGDIHLSVECTNLDKYAFSNAMALSVKLGVMEAILDKYVDGIEPVTEDLKLGREIRMNRSEVLRKTGELFALRHHINLNSDLLDVPDFFWEHELQEVLYQQTCGFFNIGRRTRVVNDRINHCIELMDLLSSHLNDEHHVRLEWMIIILIMVEVGFEIIHFVERIL